MAFFKWFQKKSVDNPGEIWREILGKASSKAGISINQRTILQLTTAQSCARVIAEDIAMLPFKLHLDRPDGGSDPAYDHAVYRLIKTKPNGWQTAFEF